MKHSGFKRPFLTLLVMTLITAVSTACFIQPSEKHNLTVGVINLSPGLEPVLSGFESGLADLGYIEGENITYLYSGAAGEISNLDAAAGELVAAGVDLILAIGTPAAQAALQADSAGDSSTPIVFAAVFDPVLGGLVRSLDTPGGNLTGVHWGLAEPRRLQLLLQLVPGINRIYFPYNPEDPAPTLALARVQEAAEDLGVSLEIREARTPEEMDSAVTRIPEDVDAVFLPPDNLFTTRVETLAETAVARRLPLSVPTPGMAESGGLVSFGISLVTSGKLAARLADQIFQGVAPSDLPVETDEFYMTINLKTARQIGLEIPDDLLLQADTIIR